MNKQWKWGIGILSIVVVFALLACGIFLAWRYLFAGKPSVVITAPPSNYQAEEGEEVTVEARATGRSIERIELWVDDGLMESVSSLSPQDAFSAVLTWEATGLGQHIVQVKAYSVGGRESDPAGVIIIVIPAEVGEVTPTTTVEPSSETPSPTTPSPSPTVTSTSSPEATPAPTITPTATPTSPPPTATPTLAPPVIDSFTIDDSTITDGETTTLRWEFHNATESHLYRDGVEIESGLSSPGDKPVNPHVTRTFKLVISNAAGSAEASVTLTVNPAGPPVIEFFKADPNTINAGDSTTLSWGLVTNATSVEIDQGIGGVGTPDSVVVSPGSTTTYTMTAVGPGGTTTASVTVTVTPAGPTVLYNFVDQAPSATWYNNAGDPITFHNDATCPDGDNKGFACWRDNKTVEDGSTPARFLETHPRWTSGGGITGRYEVNQVIQVGDVFRTKIGFMFGASAGDAKWVLGYYDGGYHVLADNTKAYNGSLENFNVDLSSLAGQTVDFTLSVWAAGSSAQDWAIWLDARIVRP